MPSWIAALYLLGGSLAAGYVIAALGFEAYRASKEGSEDEY